MTVSLPGGCFCGHLRYHVTAAPLFTLACHCTDCRQMTASAYSLGMAVPRTGFALTHGQPREHAKTADSGATSVRHVCPQCGTWTHTTTESSPDAVVVRPSSLDERRWFRPVTQIFTRSAHPWALLDVPLSYEAEFPSAAPSVQAYAASDIQPA